MGWVLLYIKRPGKSSELGWVGLGWVWVSSIGFGLKTGTNKIKKKVSF